MEEIKNEEVENVSMFEVLECVTDMVVDDRYDVGTYYVIDATDAERPILSDKVYSSRQEAKENAAIATCGIVVEKPVLVDGKYVNQTLEEAISILNNATDHFHLCVGENDEYTPVDDLQTVEEILAYFR